MSGQEEIQRAASLLKTDKLVAFPTETVYGLGGNALSDAAVAAIYAAKERPQFNPLIVHVRSLDEAQRYVEVNEKTKQLARAFWPGPLTMVLTRKKDSPLSLLLSAGLDCVAIRIPAHPLARALLHAAELPVAAPSANRSGRVSPTEAEHVRQEMEGRIAMILDGGPCSVGIESTVIDMTADTPVILRPGSVTREHLADLLGHVEVQTEGTPRAPGMLASHYAPSKPMRLNAHDIEISEALLAFGPHVPAGALQTENLSVKGDLGEAAANLFRMLRKLDAGNAIRIAVMPIPDVELGTAINDRLKRAASPKD